MSSGEPTAALARAHTHVTLVAHSENQLSAGSETIREFVVNKIALGRIGQMSAVMGPIVFLASEVSSLMTGSALMLDGGWTSA